MVDWGIGADSSCSEAVETALQGELPGADETRVGAERHALDGEVLGHERVAALVELAPHGGDERVEGGEDAAEVARRPG